MSDESNVSNSSPVSESNAPTQNNSNQAESKESANPAAEERFTVKVNGKDVQYTKKELIEKASLGSAAYEKFQEAAQAKKEAQALINQIKSNPIETLKRLGLKTEDIQGVFEPWFKSEILEPSLLTPEQRQHAERERLLAKYQQEEKTKAEQIQQAKHKQIQDYHVQKYQTDIIGGLKSVGLPATEEAVQRMAYYAKQALNAGVDAPMDMIAQRVKEDMSASINKLIGGMDAQTLINTFGKEVADKIRRHDLDQYKKSNPVIRPGQRFTPSQPNSNKDKKQGLSTHEWKAKYNR